MRRTNSLPKKKEHRYVDELGPFVDYERHVDLNDEESTGEYWKKLVKDYHKQFYYVSWLDNEERSV